MRIGEPIAKRYTYDKENGGDAQRQANRKQQRLYVHRRGALALPEAGRTNPYDSRIFRPASLFKKARKARAPSLSFALFRMIAPCPIRGSLAAPISPRIPSPRSGEHAR